ncbi:DUF418 domain-containing protein [Nocardia tengchongensis]|uniref:DUF418 domain-containing protein n=1 Tax=Nocardia tengchongensis TaxID=2055889 RepID=A0ABX8CIB8_9NOCA|nr:DUF418 domain-containing protein [Nocardia tengchongensis]QVI19706.1 DUF418 domain-containing protein [Nocardia tengchongensis]
MSEQLETQVTDVRRDRRIGVVDSLRGFALFGILVTNTVVATMFWSSQGAAGDPRPMFESTADLFVYGVVEGFFVGKFYLLFAFLFGYSFTLQIAAAERAGVAPVPRLLRRCLALFLIGLAHVLLLWICDILTLYAALGLILVALRWIRPRPALITGLVLYFGFAALAFVPGNGGLAGLGDVFDVQRMHDGFTGTFGDTLRAQLSFGPKFMVFTWLGQGIPALGMFLVGLAAGKRRVLEDAEWISRWLPRALAVGFGVGLPVSVVTVTLMTVHGKLPSFWYGVQEFANPLMTLGYAAGIVWLARYRWAGAVGSLAPAGRMAATNYIGQSVVMMLIYTGYGLALADRVPPAGVVLLAVATYLVQLRVSAWWLRQHPYGPVEWLLRAVTYRSVPAWRRP